MPILAEIENACNCNRNASASSADSNELISGAHATANGGATTKVVGAPGEAEATPAAEENPTDDEDAMERTRWDRLKRE